MTRLGTLLSPVLALGVASTAVLALHLDAQVSPLAAPAPGASGQPAAASVPHGVRGVQTALPTAARSSGGTGVIRPGAFSQVAVTWRGDAPTVRVSTHTRGAWTPWSTLEPFEDADLDEGNGTRGTDLVAVGPSDAVRVRISGGSGRDLHVVTIDPGQTDAVAYAANTVTTATTSPSATPTSITAPLASPAPYTPPSHYAPKPAILNRAKWGADESLRNGDPEYNQVIKQVHVHHTASRNDYTMGEVPGLIRGMYWYHTQSLGWNDIGYNFLIDRFGRLWEGRRGGWVTHPTRGAHTLGFNWDSTGVALIGNFEKKAPTKAALTTLVHFAAWKLDYHRMKPSGWVTVISEGSDRYPKGTYARLPVIDGHRHTNETACPGKYLFAKLPDIRTRAQARADHY